MKKQSAEVLFCLHALNAGIGTKIKREARWRSEERCRSKTCEDGEDGFKNRRGSRALGPLSMVKGT